MSCRNCQLGQGMNDCDECEIQLQRIALQRIARNNSKSEA